MSLPGLLIMRTRTAIWLSSLLLVIQISPDIDRPEVHSVSHTSSCRTLICCLPQVELNFIYQLYTVKLQVKGQRKITFDQFVTALGNIAEKKGQPLKDVVQVVLQAGGPSVSGTKAGFVKFHDDKVTLSFC